jgi:hypothetical protein
MNDVYGDKRRIVSENVRATNRNNQGTRYQICSKPKYEQVLAEGRKTVEDWIRDMDVSKQEEVSGRYRLERELERGVLIQ